MIALSLLYLFAKKAILIVGLMLVAGHNLLDGIVMEGESVGSIICIFYISGFVYRSPDFLVSLAYLRSFLDWINGLGVLFRFALPKGF
ncbi:MAG: hypothetical protein R2750_14090 [Bacteroidales bacterium]